MNVSRRKQSNLWFAVNVAGVVVLLVLCIIELPKEASRLDPAIALFGATIVASIAAYCIYRGRIWSQYKFVSRVDSPGLFWGNIAILAFVVGALLCGAFIDA